METIKEVLGVYCGSCSAKHLKPMPMKEVSDEQKKKDKGVFHKAGLACPTCGAFFTVSYIESEHHCEVERIPRTIPETVTPG